MIKSDRHALYCGWVVGLLARQAGLNAYGVMDEMSDWTDLVQIILPNGDHDIGLFLVIPEPPDDWALGG